MSFGSTACRAIFLILSALEREIFFYRLRSNQRGRMLSIVGDFGKIRLELIFYEDLIFWKSPAVSVLATRSRGSWPERLASEISKKTAANFEHKCFQPVEMLQIRIVNYRIERRVSPAKPNCHIKYNIDTWSLALQYFGVSQTTESIREDAPNRL